jgi:hypothetical protein
MRSVAYGKENPLREFEKKTPLGAGKKIPFGSRH